MLSLFFSFSLKSSILLIFFFHGIVFASLLFVKGWQQERASTKWLGLFSLLCALYIAPFMLGYAGWYSKQPYRNILFYIPFQQLFLFGPVLFFYVRSLLDQSFRFTRNHWLHFLPSALYGVYALVVFVTDRIVLKEAYFYEDGNDKDFSTWYQIAGFCSLAFYLFRSLQVYNTYKSMTYNLVSFADSVMFRWTQRFLIAFLLLIGIRFLFFILNPEAGAFGQKFWYYVCFSLLFYYITISGYTNSLLSATPFSPETAEPVTEPQTETEQKMPDLELWKTKVEALMTKDRMYEDPELIIAALAGKLDTHAKKISQVINQGFGMNFNDFVNHYRIRAMKQKIEEGEHNIQTLLGLAFDCGFNSKSTFNRAFRRETSLTPKEYIEKNYKN
jgi:AraC-like DNA-binding protein